MSAVENREVVRRLVEEFWNKRNAAVLDDVFAPNFLNHNPPFGSPPDREGLKHANNMFLAAFSEIHTAIDDLITEGDKVVWRWTFSGRNTGPLADMPATGKQINMTGIVIDRIVGGQIVERWSEMDIFGLMQQLGAIPTAREAGG